VEEVEEGFKGRGEIVDEVEAIGSTGEVAVSSPFCSDASINCRRSRGLNFLFVVAGESFDP
jgi:hypothetical protein